MHAMAKKISDLEERNRELEELLGLTNSAPRPEGISEQAWKMAGLLAKHRLVTREFAFRAIYGSRPESDQPATIQIIDQVVCRLRRFLVGTDIVIKCEARAGYYADTENRKRINGFLNR